MGHPLGSCTWPYYNSSTAPRPSGWCPSIRFDRLIPVLTYLKLKLNGDLLLLLFFHPGHVLHNTAGGTENRGGRVSFTRIWANLYNEYCIFVCVFTTIGHLQSCIVLFTQAICKCTGDSVLPHSASWQESIKNAWELCIQHSSQHISWVFNNVYSLDLLCTFHYSDEIKKGSLLWDRWISMQIMARRNQKIQTDHF